MNSTTIRVGGETPVFQSFADFLDGDTATLHRVSLVMREVAKSEALAIGMPEGGEIIWPLAQIRQRPDQAGRDTLVLSLAGAGEARLIVRDGEARAILSARCAHLSKREPAQKRGKLLAWALGAVASVGVIIFALVPLLADQLAGLLPPEGEKALGDATFEQIRGALADNESLAVSVCSTPAGQSALDDMVERLSGNLDMPYPIVATVLDHKLVNAFALPGGRVILFRGLIDAAESSDEVAAVMAHEIGHVINRDPTRGALRSAGSIGVLGLLFGDFAGGTAVLYLVNRLIDASYSQEAEAAADRFAHEILADNNIRPSALATMFERLLAKGGDVEGIVAHFQAHPRLGDRIAAARAADTKMAGATSPLLGDEQWRAFQTICR